MFNCNISITGTIFALEMSLPIYKDLNDQNVFIAGTIFSVPATEVILLNMQMRGK